MASSISSLTQWEECAAISRNVMRVLSRGNFFFLADPHCHKCAKSQNIMCSFAGLRFPARNCEIDVILLPSAAIIPIVARLCRRDMTPDTPEWLRIFFKGIFDSLWLHMLYTRNK